MNRTSSGPPSGPDHAVSGYPSRPLTRDIGRYPVVDQQSAPGTEEPRPRRGIRRWFLPVLVFLVVAGPLLELALIGAIYIQARTDQARPVDAIVVLGTTQYNGVPSPTLEARLDQAIDLYRDGFAPLIVVTGGNLPGDVYTEAEAGQMFLVEAGVPENAILLENEGNDSWQSMNGVAGILAARNLDRVLLVSDGFHLLRLKMMARELGITAFGTAADNSPIAGGEEFGYVVREALAITAFVFGRR